MADRAIRPLVLKGKVVTFDARLGVLDKGAIYIQPNDAPHLGAIEAVQGADAPAPAGYAQAPTVWSPFSNLWLYGATTDVVAAHHRKMRICLGADWVGMGRLYCYGLAAAGAAGIERVVELLEEEMKEVMGLLGVTSLKQLEIPSGGLGDFFGPGTTVGIPFAAQLGVRVTF